MVGRTTVVAVAVSGLVALFGCGGGGDDYYSQVRGASSGAATLDIAGSYSVAPDDFGFNMLTIQQSGNDLTASDNGGGSWSGTLSNIVTDETSGIGGALIMTWRGDVNLTGTNAVDDDLSLRGVVEITPGPSMTTSLFQITAQYENVSIGLTGQLVLSRVSATPGGIPGGGGGDGSGNENK